MFVTLNRNQNFFSEHKEKGHFCRFNDHILFFSEIMVNMGYSRQNIEDSVIHQKFDDIQATYLLLGRRTPDVSIDWAQT